MKSELLTSLSAKIDQRITEIANQFAEKEIGPFLDELLLNMAAKEFPGNQLALLKVYLYLRENWDDKAVISFLEDYKYKQYTATHALQEITQYEMDESAVSTFDIIADSEKQEIEFYEQQIKFEESHPESWFSRLLHPFNNSKTRIRSYRCHVSVAKQALQAPLSQFYEEARDRQVDWLLKFKVSNKQELQAKLNEFRQYTAENVCLYQYLKSIQENAPIDLKTVRKTAEQSAWDGCTVYGNDGSTLVVFDIAHPDQYLEIVGRIDEPIYEDFTTISYLLCNKKRVDSDAAADIVNKYAHPCLYTESAYQQFLPEITEYCPPTDKTRLIA